MADSFKNDCDRIQRLLISIRSDINKRDQKKAASLPVAMIEGEIRGQLTNLGDIVQYQEINVITAQEKNQSQNGVSQKELEKKRNQYTQFLNEKNELKSKFESSMQQARDQLFSGQGAKTGKFTDNYDTQNMSNQQLYKAQKDLEAQQDAQLDKVNEKLTTIKLTGQGMNENIKQQNKMLDQVNNDVDQTTKEMMRTNSKMKKFIANSSNTWLILTILVEIVVLILCVIYV